MNLPTLYHKTKKGKIQICKMWTEGNIIFTEFGYQDGKKQIAEQICHPKNVGKKNETTGEQQAQSEATSKWQKKLDKKYTTNLAAVDEVRISPMLAKKYTEKRARWPAIVQRKLNGLRCMAYWEDGEIVLHSRGNKFYDVAHIKAMLEHEHHPLPKDMIFDGELYIHGVSLQTINSLVKKPKPGSEKLEYRVYDLCKIGEDLTQEKRAAWIKFYMLSRESAFVKYEPSPIAESAEEMALIHTQFVKDGYEGTIIRNLDGIYRFGFRSDDLLKYKDFEDAEYLVVGFTEGTGKFTGTPIWICETEEGKQFNVTPTGSLDSRKAAFPNASDSIGQYLTVRFIGKTDDKIPYFGVGIAFRLNEDLPVMHG